MIRHRIVVSAAIEYAREEDRDAAVAATSAIQQGTRDEEPGCLAYCFAADPCVGTRIQVYELWVDEASLAAHFQHPYYHSMRAKLGEFGIVSAVSRKYRTDLDEPVYDATRTPRADFIGA
jgi:quinol monooxygenase YgiN